MTKHLFNRIIILVIISTIAVGCGNSIGPKQSGVSAVIPLQEETLSGFWDRFDFADTALIHRPDITEQMFADFLMALSQADDNRRNAAVDTLLARSLRAGVGMFLHFTDLSEKYLETPIPPIVMKKRISRFWSIS